MNTGFITAKDYAVRVGKTEKRVVNEIRAGQLVGQIRDGVWYVAQDQPGVDDQDRDKEGRNAPNRGADNVAARRGGRIGALVGAYLGYSSFVPAGYAWEMMGSAPEIIAAGIGAALFGSLFGLALGRWALK